MIRINTILFTLLLTTNVYAWEGIVVHHSATEHGTVESIDTYHKSKGWDGIGYHYIVHKNGLIEVGRDINKVGAHAKGRNKTHIGVCLIGKDLFTAKQIKSLEVLVKVLVSQYGVSLPEKHHRFCPGEGLDIETINRRIQDELRQREKPGHTNYGSYEKGSSRDSRTSS